MQISKPNTTKALRMPLGSEYTLPVRDWGQLAWTLLLLNSIRRGGLEGIGSLRFHRLQFFANSLAPIYEERPPVELVMKLERGPYYPDAQDDIDTLCVCGLADVKLVEWHSSGSRMWKTADYEITKAGIELASRLATESQWCGRLATFLDDLVLAYTDLADGVLDAVALKDVTYAQKGKSLGDIIPFSLERNLGVRASGAIADLLPSDFAPNRRNRLRMYLRYLEQLAA